MPPKKRAEVALVSCVMRFARRTPGMPMAGAACTGSAVRSQAVCLPALLWRRRNCAARPTLAIATNSRLDGSGTCLVGTGLIRFWPLKFPQLPEIADKKPAEAGVCYRVRMLISGCACACRMPVRQHRYPVGQVFLVQEQEPGLRQRGIPCHAHPRTYRRCRRQLACWHRS